MSVALKPNKQQQKKTQNTSRKPSHPPQAFNHCLSWNPFTAKQCLSRVLYSWVLVVIYNQEWGTSHAASTKRAMTSDTWASTLFPKWVDDAQYFCCGEERGGLVRTLWRCIQSPCRETVVDALIPSLNLLKICYIESHHFVLIFNSNVIKYATSSCRIWLKMQVAQTNKSIEKLAPFLYTAREHSLILVCCNHVKV